MNWDDLKFFLALARQGSLSATARFLETEHTTVARRITKLEKALGVKLFDRLAKGWRLTAEGKVLFKRTCDIELEVKSLQIMAKSQASYKGKVKISLPPLLLNHFVMLHLNELRLNYPEIKLELIGERRVANLIHGEVDIAIRLGELTEPELVARKLGAVSYGLYGTKSLYNLPQSEQVFIGFDESIANLPQKLWLEAFLKDRNYSLYTNDITTMYQACKQSWGIALLPNFLGDSDSSLQKLEIDISLLMIPIFLVMHADIRHTPRVRVVADYLIKVFKQYDNEEETFLKLQNEN